MRYYVEEKLTQVDCESLMHMLRVKCKGVFYLIWKQHDLSAMIRKDSTLDAGENMEGF